MTPSRRKAADSVIRTGAELRTWRRMIDVPQTALARRLGVARNTVSLWEQRKRLDVVVFEAIEAVRYKLQMGDETTAQW